MAEPTPSTAKKLAALSLNRCPFPGCEMLMVDPKYKTFQGDVCHIRSRKVNGPRYDKDYKEDLNSEVNLILLCKVHNTVIDDPHNAHLFPVAKLEEWKRDIEHKAAIEPNTELKQAIARGIQESIEFKVLEDKEEAKLSVKAGRELQCDNAEDFITINLINAGNTFATIRSISIGYPDQSLSNEESETLRFKDITIDGKSEYEVPVVRLSTLLSKFQSEIDEGFTFLKTSDQAIDLLHPYDDIRFNNYRTRGFAVIVEYENLFRTQTRLLSSVCVLFGRVQ
jgi:hypothetical protein